MIKKFILTALAMISTTFAMAVVNINTASKTELQTLKGIGAKKADAIIEYRTQNKGFKTVEDLANVKGIGTKTVEKLKSEISVSDQNPKPSANTKPVPATK